MSYRTETKKSTIPIPLTGVTLSISQKVQDILRSMNKNYPIELLLKYGARQGMRGDIPVLAFPMGGESFHCVTYSTYPKEPRFLSASMKEREKATLGLLGLDIFLQQEDQSTVFIAEGLWDMLTLAQYGYPVIGLPGVTNLQDSWLDFFRGKKVYLLYDNDSPGRKFSVLHCNKLNSITSFIKTLYLPKQVEHLNEKYKIKDISDLFAVSSSFAKGFLDKLVEEDSPGKDLIRDVIFDIILAKGNSAQKAQDISRLIISDIENNGGDVVPYGDGQELALVIEGQKVLTEEKVDIHLGAVYGYLPSQSIWSQAREELYNHAVRKEGVTVDNFSTTKDGKCYLGTKKNGLLIIEPDKIHWEDQGYEGVFIKSGNDLDPSSFYDETETNTGETPTTIDGIFDMFIYKSEAPLKKFILKIWFYFTFFEPIMRSTLLITGPPGCGKSFLQKLIKGTLFGFLKGVPNPNSIPEEDYIFSMICKEYRYFFCDEVNENSPQIKSKIRTLVTGEESILRPKYAKKYLRFRPKVWLSLSAHSPKFRDPDIAQRLLIIELEKLEEKKLINEEIFFKKMEEVRPILWRNITKELQEIFGNLIKNKNDEMPLGKTYLRQVEMGQFAWAAFPEQRKICLAAFSKLYSGQQDFALEVDPIVDVLWEWWEGSSMQYTNGNGSATLEARQLFKDLQPIVKERGIRSFPMSVAGFAKWMVNRSEKLNEYFGFEKEKIPSSNSFKYKFNLPEKEKF